MSLPRLKAPTYTITVPSTKEEVKFKPFTVKEENALLIARESNDEATQMATMIDVLESCTFGKVNVENLAMFDIEYLFVNIRAKSVGEVVEIDMKCKNIVDEKECGGIISFDVNLSTVKVNIPEEHTTNVMVGEGIGVTFRYPNVTMYSKIKGTLKESPVLGVISLIRSIYDAETVYEASEYSKDEMIEFVESIPSSEMQNVKSKFIDSMPQLQHSAKWKCPKCGKEGVHTFKGLAEFFG